MEIAARYRPAGIGAEVGGDFYDAWPVDDGFALAIGDVAGQGPGSRSADGPDATRHARRVALRELAEPRAAGRERGDPRARQRERVLHRRARVPAAVGRAATTLTVACAGHAPPFVLRDADARDRGGRHLRHAARRRPARPVPRLHDAARRRRPADLLDGRRHRAAQLGRAVRRAAARRPARAACRALCRRRRAAHRRGRRRVRAGPPRRRRRDPRRASSRRAPRSSRPAASVAPAAGVRRRTDPRAHRDPRHLSERRPLPRGGRRDRDACSERLGHEAVFPRGQTCCGQMHWNSGYRREALSLIRRTVETLEPYERRRLPVGIVHRDDPRAVRARCGRRRRRLGLAAAVARCAGGSSSSPSCWSTGSASRTSAPSCTRAPSTTPPATRLRGLRVGDRPYRLLRAVRGLELLELSRADECCGFGGHLRRQERRDLGRDGRGQGRRGRGERRGRAGRRRPLVPHAHRRRALPRRIARADAAPRRGARRGRPRHDERAASRSSRSPRPRAASSATSSCARTCASRPTRSRAKRGPRRRRAARLGAAAPRRRGDQAPHAPPPRRLPRGARGDASSRAGGVVHWATRRGRRDRDRDAPRAGRGRRRDRQGQVDGDRRDRAQRGARGAPACRRSRPISPS